jgi:hypothetical protein
MYLAYRDDWATSGREYTGCQKPSKDAEMHSLKKRSKEIKRKRRVNEIKGVKTSSTKEGKVITKEYQTPGMA